MQRRADTGTAVRSRLGRRWTRKPIFAGPFSGHFADKTHKYWAVARVRYSINIFTVPALALTGTAEWDVAP
jgi:hypothetical protein